MLFVNRLSRLPYWLLAALLLGVFFLWAMLSREDYRVILTAVSQGVATTVYVTLVAYALATLFGLLLGLMRVSHSRPAQEVATFYIEIIRGVPMLVILYYIAFVGAPGLSQAVNALGRALAPVVPGLGEALTAFQVRNFDFTTRAIVALTVGYSAFIAEIFRAGIESIGKEQTEAAQTEGANYWQTMRFILLPQAVRNVLPALGNEFIAMLKDSALVSVLGVQDITQLGKVYSASTFNFFGTYSIAALLYLVMTLGLALLVRWVEQNISLK